MPVSRSARRRGRLLAFAVDVVLSDFQALPEPGMLGLLGLGGAMMFRQRRKGLE